MAIACTRASSADVFGAAARVLPNVNVQAFRESPYIMSRLFQNVADLIHINCIWAFPKLTSKPDTLSVTVHAGASYPKLSAYISNQILIDRMDSSTKTELINRIENSTNHSYIACK